MNAFLAFWGQIHGQNPGKGDLVFSAIQKRNMSIWSIAIFNFGGQIYGQTYLKKPLSTSMIGLFSQI